jgi:hypothetical protein
VFIAATHGVPWIWIIVGTGAVCALFRLGPWGPGGLLDYKGRAKRAGVESCPTCAHTYKHDFDVCARGEIGIPDPQE